MTTNEDLVNAIYHIERTLVLRWWVFALMALAMGFAAWAGVSSLTVLNRVEGIIRTADARSVKNEAAIDAAIKQQIAYQQQIAQSIDFLAAKNPKIIVPKAIVRPPPAPSVTPDGALKIVPETLKPLTESDLARPTAVPSPTQVKSAQPQTSVRKKRRPMPTPGPWQRLFNPKSTR